MCRCQATMDLEQCKRDIEALDAAPPNANYGIALGGPPFLDLPAIGSRIRLECGADGALGWSCDAEGKHIVTAINRHPNLIDVRLKHV